MPTGQQLVSLLAEGAIFGILSIGVYVAFRWLRFPDLTPDGSFALGAALFVIARQWSGSTVLAFFAVLVAGALCGVVTATVACKLRVPSVISGLAVSSALYSVVLILLKGPNRALGSGRITLGFTGTGAALVLLAICAISAFVVVGALAKFSSTIWGLRLKALGENPSLYQDLHASLALYTVVGLSIANALAAFAGALMVQRTFSADIGIGVGMTISGLAGMMIGGAMAARSIENRFYGLFAIVLGALIERSVSFIAIQIGIPGSTFRLGTATLLLAVFAIASMRAKASFRGIRWT